MSGSTLVIHTLTTKAFNVSVFAKPVAEINGRRVELAWGKTSIPVQPGTNHLRLRTESRWKEGYAEITLDIDAGSSRTIYYARPILPFLKGSVGLKPVSNPGVVVYGLIMGIPLLFLVFFCVAGALGD